jgi:hypothetical protein
MLQFSNTLKILFFTGIVTACLFLFSCDLNRELSVTDFKFDGPLGSEGARIEKVGINTFKITMGHAPTKPDWSNMLNFENTGNARGNELMLIVKGPSRYPVNSYFYSWSHDRENWNPVHWHNGSRSGVENDTLTFPVFTENRVYVGHQVPLSYNQIEDLYASIQSNPSVSIDTLGQSLGGKNIYRLTITDNNKEIPLNQRWGHYFINLHPGEHNAQWRMIGMIEWLLSDQGADFRKRSISHFVLMISPDAPEKGWYRVNAQGVDMNRSYSPEGADVSNQAHEAYMVQKDLELLMKSDRPVTTLWGMHTWQGPVEPLVYFVQDERLGPWTDWRDALLRIDRNRYIKPLATREKSGYGASSWEYGSHLQFGITTVLCEGGGAIYTKEENKQSGVHLIESLGKYYRGLNVRDAAMQ